MSEHKRDSATKVIAKSIHIFLLFTLLFTGFCTQKKDKTIDNLVMLILLDAYLNPACKNSVTLTNGIDPLFSSQWHLNQGNNNDAGVEVPWAAGIRGSGITVAVVDDGMESKHEDLCGNISSVKSYNYFKNSTDPDHFYIESGHGTSVAGIIAAQMNNNIGLRGAAPSAKLTARNLLELTTISSSAIADAMALDISSIHISNNSWGAQDRTGLYSEEYASSLWKSAIQNSITVGRGGLGTLYTWAGGNGAYGVNGSIVDNSNNDGQANYHGVLAICGIGKDGRKAYYSEDGANLWVCAHTMGNDFSGISTTDRMGDMGGNNLTKSTNFSDRSYRNDFNGTSSSAPLAAGVIALLLSKYPTLSWRDVREIIAESAVKNHSTDSGWTTNGANLNINHKYGFGAINANAAILKAASWTPISSSKTYDTYENSSITNTNTSFTTTSSNINYIEFIEIYFTTNEPNMGIITVALIHENNTANASGLTSTSSILVEPHLCYTTSGATRSCENYSSSATTLRYGSSRHLGESVNTGSWKVLVTGGSGTYSTKLIFRGRSSK